MRTLTIALAVAVALATAAPAAAKLSKGDPAPPFELETVDGGRITAAELADRPLVVLTFVSLGSKPSRELTLALADLVRSHGKDGLTVVAVAGDPAEALKRFAEEQKLGFPVCSDPSRETLGRYGADQVVPMTYLLAPGGTIAEIIPGGGMAAQQALLAVAQKEFARGNAAAAGAAFGAALKQDPKSLEAKTGLGFALARQGKLERAEEEFRSLESAGPAGAAAAAEGLADVRLRKGDLDGAAKALERVNGDRPFARVLRGEIAAGRNDLAAAEKEFSAAVAEPSAIAWQNGSAFRNLANVSRARGKTDAALRAYDRAIEAEPFLVAARSDKGAVLEKAGRRAEAKKELAAAKRLARPAQLVGTLLRRIEEQEKAKVDLERQKLVNQLVGELAESFRSGKLPPPPKDEWSPRARVVSLLDFQAKLGPLAREGLAEAFVAGVTRRLQETGKVRVVEREMIDKLLAELKLGSSELADGSTRLKLGRVLAAAVIGTGGLYPAGTSAELQLRLIDTETTDVRETITETLANPAEVASFAAGVADEIAEEVVEAYPLKGKIASVKGDEIVVSIGRKHGAAPGSRFDVVTDGEAIEVDGEILGHEQKRIGRLEVTRVEEAFAYAKAVEGEDFEKGQHLVEAKR